MITVSILINGKAIYTRSAVNKTDDYPRGEKDVYEVDDGSLLRHKRDDGAIKLAIEMLKTIKESR